MKKAGWDELGDVDDLLKSDPLVNRSSNVSVTPSVSNSRPQQGGVDIVSCDSQSNKTKIVESEVISDNSGKPRRRSALADDAGNAEVKAVGYSSRSQRLAEQNQYSGVSELAEEDKSEFNRLLAKGVYLLGMREHSVQEMTDKLTARSDAVDVVLAVIDELLENNYLSNERFAEGYVRSRRNKGFGPVKIRVELKTKGISGRLISEHLQAESPEWIDVAREQYKKKYRSKAENYNCLLYTSPSPRDKRQSRMPSSA